MLYDTVYTKLNKNSYAKVQNKKITSSTS